MRQARLSMAISSAASRVRSVITTCTSTEAVGLPLRLGDQLPVAHHLQRLEVTRPHLKRARHLVRQHPRETEMLRPADWALAAREGDLCGDALAVARRRDPRLRMTSANGVVQVCGRATCATDAAALSSSSTLIWSIRSTQETGHRDVADGVCSRREDRIVEIPDGGDHEDEVLVLVDAVSDVELQGFAWQHLEIR